MFTQRILSLPSDILYQPLQATACDKQHRHHFEIQPYALQR